MTGTFLATWITLRRRTLLWGTYATTAALLALFTAVIFLNTSDSAATTQEGAPPGAGVTRADLVASGGLLQGLTSGATFVGVIALSVAAAAVAGQYTTGTLRNLLIRQPRRLRLLAGTWAALATFVVGAVLLAAVVAALVAVALAGPRDVDTSAWFTADAWGEHLRSVGQVALSGLGFATLGAALGVLLRTSVLAVSLGLAWLLPVETILSGTIDDADRWLPGQLLAAVASGGTATVSLAAALTTVVAYVVVAAGAAGTSFVRRDVTA